MTDPECRICGVSSDLQEHHISYEPEVTTALCVECHREVHGHGVGMSSREKDSALEVNFQLEGRDEEVWKRFKSFVMRNEGKIKGVLGKHVARALEEYMESNPTSKKEKFGRKTSNVSLKRAYKVWSGIISDETTFEIGDQVPEPVVERKIKRICGASGNTIRKYKNIMTTFDLLLEAEGSEGGDPVYEICPEPEWVEKI